MHFFPKDKTETRRFVMAVVLDCLLLSLWALGLFKHVGVALNVALFCTWVGAILMILAVITTVWFRLVGHQIDDVDKRCSLFFVWGVTKDIVLVVTLVCTGWLNTAGVFVIASVLARSYRKIFEAKEPSDAPAL